MVFFVTRLCFDRSRLYFLLMSTKNIDRASIDGSIVGARALPVALATSFTSLLTIPSLRGPRTPFFDRYIGIDYSGARTPTSSLKGLRI
jgi:hypothetical protein